MSATATAELAHVAGQPEKESRDNEAGWEWVQRCLRCDRLLDTSRGFRELGQVVLEYGNGMRALHEDEQLRVAQATGVRKCSAGPRMVIEDER